LINYKDKYADMHGQQNIKTAVNIKPGSTYLNHLGLRG